MNELEKYIEFCVNVRHLKPRTVEEYVYSINTINSEIDLISASSQPDIDEAIIALKKKRGWSDIYCYKVSKILVTYYKWLHYSGAISRNPYITTQFRRTRMKEPEYLTQLEFEFIESNPNLSHQDRTILRVFWDCGLRRGELAKLEQSDVDLEGSVIRVRQEASKGEYGARYTPFSDKTAYLLRDQIKMLQKQGITSYLFINSEFGRLDDEAISEKLAHIGKIRLPNREPIRLHPHLLRHSLPMRLLEAGADHLFIMKIMGHKSITMLNHYTHVNKSVKKLYDKYLKSA